MVAGGLIGVVVGILIALVIGAVVLRAAVALYNKLAGGADLPTSVPEPAFGKAMGITLITGLINAAFSFCFGIMTGSGPNASVDRPGYDLVAQLISMPISLLIMAGMLSALLPTTFGRAILVTLCEVLIWLLIVIGAVFVGAFVVFVAGPLHR